MALTVYASPSGPRLIAGGTYRILKSWDGSAWSEVGGGISAQYWAQVNALAQLGGDLYVGGRFQTAGGIPANSIVRWNGSTFSPLTGPAGNGVTDGVEEGGVGALAVYDDGAGSRLLVGGSFAFAGGVPVEGFASWSNDGWATVCSPSVFHGLDGSAAAMIDSASGSLVVGGSFTDADTVTVNNISLWNGSAWSALSGPAGTGTDGSVLSLARFDDGGGEDLYAGGEFTTAGGNPASAVATWDGAAWSPLQGSGSVALNGRVEAMAVCDLGSGPALFAGGSFSTAGGITVNGVARWDGSSWWPLTGSHGTGTGGGVVLALECYDDGTGPSLYVGGEFFVCGTVEVNHVARWDGAEWYPLIGLAGVGVSSDDYSSEVLAMEVYDDGGGERLYVGGQFDYAAGTWVSGVATWDGTAWDRLYTPFGVGVNGSVSSLVVADDGRGPALFAGGTFEAAGGKAVSNVARWDGTTWTSLAGSTGTGTDGPFIVTVLVLWPHLDGGGPALYAGGDFTFAGGITSRRIARWSCAESLLFQDGFESGTLDAWSRVD